MVGPKGADVEEILTFYVLRPNKVRLMRSSASHVSRNGQSLKSVKTSQVWVHASRITHHASRFTFHVSRITRYSQAAIWVRLAPLFSGFHLKAEGGPPPPPYSPKAAKDLALNFLEPRTYKLTWTLILPVRFARKFRAMKAGQESRARNSASSLQGPDARS